MKIIKAHVGNVNVCKNGCDILWSLTDINRKKCVLTRGKQINYS